MNPQQRKQVMSGLQAGGIEQLNLEAHSVSEEDTALTVYKKIQVL